MPTIHISISDEDVDRIAKRFALKLAEALKENQSPKPTQPEPTQPMTANPPSEWLTLKEVQQMFQISRPTLYRWTHEQGLPVKRFGNIVRISASKLREWAERRAGRV